MAMTKDEKIKLYEELMEDKDFLHEMNKREQADLKYEGEIAYAKDEGKKEGIEEGIEKGIKQTELNVAKRMKNSNFSFDDIAKITGLSLEEIEKI